MNAPLDTIGTIDTTCSDAPAEECHARLLNILGRLKALDRSAPAPKSPDAEPSVKPASVIERHPSAWAEAVHVGKVRDRRKAQGLDVSVRAIANDVGCSRGHAGDCLKIRDAFSDTLLHFIGENDSQDDGRVRLARLSFRTLRSLARLPTDLARIREARR